jgi:hypothetical protein
MMINKKLRFVALCFVVLLLALSPVGAVLAQVGLGHGFSGSVKVDGVDAPAGAVVSAQVGGTQYASRTVTTPGQYFLIVQGEIDDGATIEFYVDGQRADQTFPFHDGWTTILDLTVTTTPPTYELTMAASPESGGTATDLTDASPYEEGAEVSIKAVAATGYQFVNWSALAGEFDDADATETTFTMPAQDVTVTANFEGVPLPPEAPTVTTKAATSVGTDSATLNMAYTVGDYSSVKVCFAYKKSADSTWTETAWVSKTADGTYAKTLTGLSSNTKYDFKAQLEYDSTTIVGTTLSFTTAEAAAGCFIATAAYGTPTAQQLDVLRAFRDEVLLESTLGTKFVELYYRTSPPIADFIAGHEAVRTMVRELLIDPIVWVVGATEDMWRN